VAESAPEATRREAGRLWARYYGGRLLCFLVALEIAIFGIVPGVADPTSKKLYLLVHPWQPVW